jgi:hypothetical protein
VSDLMLLGVLQMPIEMVMSDTISTIQYIQRGHEAAERIKADVDLLEAANARIKALEAEVTTLRDGDTCARQCEGTAFRIEARQAKARITALESERATLLHDVEIHARDAERYRFARENIREGHELPGSFYLSDSGAGWDKTIDAALANQKQAG